MNNTVVYTCVTGGYDEILPPKSIEEGIDYVCLTDDQSIACPGWEKRIIAFDGFDSPMLNRFAKINPHIFFPNYERSIYVDGNIEIVGGIRSFVNYALVNNDIALYNHPFRNCIYKEAVECASIGYEWNYRIARQVNSYAKAEYPKNNGMYECGVVARRHNEKKIIELMDAWWVTYVNGVRRDQISLPYLAWKIGVEIENMGNSDFRFDRKNFSITLKHRKKRGLIARLRGNINRRTLKMFGLDNII